MKKTTLAVLAVASLFQVQGALAEIPQSRLRETITTTNINGLEDKYFQIQSSKLTILSDEEALVYENESALTVTNKNFTGIVPGGIPNIPPIPPQADPKPDGGLNIGSGPGGNRSPMPAAQPQTAVSGIIAIIDELIAIGEKIIPTIDKGRAVVNNNPMNAVSVLPRIDTKDPVVHDMGNWSIPVSKHFKISYANGFGVEVASFVYSITFQHSGTYDGKGHYLAGIRMSARDISVSWGFDLDASSQLIQISNVGTPDNVIAGATVEINYSLKNWTRTLSTTKAFHVTGDGRIFALD